MDSSSVAAAVAGGDGTRWHSSVIQVVPHHKAATVERCGLEAMRTAASSGVPVSSQLGDCLGCIGTMGVCACLGQL